MNLEVKNDSIEIEYKKQEPKAPTEEIIVSGDNTFVPKIDKLDVEIEAKRPGPKSGAQTPAKPSERRKGSSKNKSGSAGTNGDAITFSTKVIEMLKNKVKNHNAKHSRKVNLTQLKKVYRRGAGAFSSSHRPGMTRGGWAAARVNMFLRMMAGKSVKDSYRKADSDVARSSTSIDISDSWELEDVDFTEAEVDIKEYDLNYDFENVEELYLDEEDNSNKFWYEL